MVSKTELHMNYTAITHLPIVQRTLKCVSRLTRENKELKKENDMLKKMIDTLFDRQLSGNTNCCGGCHKSTQSPISEVHIKKEKVVIDISEETENITYELRDSCNNSDKPFAYDLNSDLNSETIEKDTVSDNINCNETKIINNIVEETSNVVEVEESEEEEVEVEESEEEEVEVEESEEEEEVEVEVEESEEEVEVEVEVEESEEEEEVEVEEYEEEEEVEVEESEEEVEVEVEVEESEEEEEVEVEVEESEEVEVEVEESEEEVEVEESEEDEVYEVTIKNKSYYTTNETDGPIYAILDDEDIGDQIGEFKEGKPTFYRKTKK
ncbi:hypothetical protein OAS95_01085 [Pelagibacteraceae bacterium]|nr:hypothetical protein [Pelagibacteraceae bacterium]